MFRASLRPSSGEQTACHCLWLSVLAVAVVVLESCVVRCVHCEEDVACKQQLLTVPLFAHVIILGTFGNIF